MCAATASNKADWKENTKRIAVITGDGALLVLSSIKEASDAFPPLKSAAASILILADLISNFHRNKEEWNDLGRIVAERVSGIAKHIGNDPSPDLKESLESLNRVLNSITEEVQKMQSRSRVTRALSIQADKERTTAFFDRMKNELDTLSLLANLTVLKLASNGPPPPSGPLDSDINWVPPPPPIFFYGRDAYISSMLAVIQSKLSSSNSTGAHLLIRGPGGIGKTTVAQSLFHNDTILSLFGENRFFVRCEAASNYSLLLSAIASALHLDISRKDALSTILSSLRADKEPLLLVLDNAESFWQSSSTTRKDSRAVLQHLSTIKRITLVMTIRGIEQPTAVKWDQLPPLDSLSLLAARETFIAIAEIPDTEKLHLHSDTPDPGEGQDSDDDSPDELDSLLEEVDRVPLAVTLLARVHQTGGGSIPQLRKRLLQEKSDLLNMGPIDREDNIGISIKLSLESQLMIQNPSAMRLLSILALLPTGALMGNLEAGSEGPSSGDEAPGPGPVFTKKPMTAMRIDELQNGSHTLKHLLLASESPMTRRITSLSPVRLYIMKHFPPSSDDLQNLQSWHLELASSAHVDVNNFDYPQTLSILAQEKGNISFILGQMLSSGLPDAKLLAAILGFTRYLADFDISDSELLEEVLNSGVKERFKTSTEHEHLLLAASINILGHIKHKRSDLVEADKLISESLEEYRAINHTYNEAEAMRELCEIKIDRRQFQEAAELIQSAKEKFEQMERWFNVAECIQLLGVAKRCLGLFTEAERLLKKAREGFQLLTSHGRESEFNAARCLHSLGLLQLEQLSDYIGSTQSFEQALAEFEKLNDRDGIANCLVSLGNSKRMQLKFQEAQPLLEKARKEFKQLGNRYNAALCAYDLGDMMRFQGRYTDAERHLNDAIKEYRILDERLSMTNALYSLGDLKVIQKLYPDAEKLLNEAKEEYKRLESPYDVARCLFSLANLNHSRGNYLDAERLYGEAKSEFKALDNQYYVALCLQKFGTMKLTQGAQDEAERTLSEARPIFKTLGRAFELGKTLSKLGDIKTNQSKYAEADQLYQESCMAFQSIGYQRDAIVAAFNVGESKRLQSKFQEAKQVLEMARSASQSVGMQYTAAISLYSLGELKLDEYNDEQKQTVQNSSENSTEPNSTETTTSANVDRSKEVYEDAKKCFTESIESLRTVPSTSRIELGTRLMKFGGYALLAKDHEIAKALLEESLEIFRSAGMESEIQRCQGFISCLPNDKSNQQEPIKEVVPPELNSDGTEANKKEQIEQIIFPESASNRQEEHGARGLPIQNPNLIEKMKAANLA